MAPPIEKGNAETNMDSEASGDMNDGLVWNMTRFWLTKKVNGNLYNELNAQLRNQQNHLQGTGKKALNCIQLSETSVYGKNNQVIYWCIQSYVFC